jgi:hypothetical protein
VIALLIFLAVIATGAVTINLGLLALVVYLCRSRRKALSAVQSLNNACQSLLVDRAYWIAKEEAARPLYVNKGSAIH